MAVAVGEEWRQGFTGVRGMKEQRSHRRPHTTASSVLRILVIPPVGSSASVGATKESAEAPVSHSEFQPLLF